MTPELLAYLPPRGRARFNTIEREFLSARILSERTPLEVNDPSQERKAEAQERKAEAQEAERCLNRAAEFVIKAKGDGVRLVERPLKAEPGDDETLEFIQGRIKEIGEQRRQLQHFDDEGKKLANRVTAAVMEIDSKLATLLAPAVEKYANEKHPPRTQEIDAKIAALSKERVGWEMKEEVLVRRAMDEGRRVKRRSRSNPALWLDVVTI